MLARARERQLRHWEDPTLLHVVHQDLHRKNGWADLRVVSLGLPPCACCHRDSGVEREDQTGTASSETIDTSTTRRCGNTAHGIAGTVREEESTGDGDVDGNIPEAGLAKVVFAVNAGCPIPTRRFGDVVAAAEEHLGLCAHDQMAEDRGKRHPPRVLAAFCDGSSIMWEHSTANNLLHEDAASEA